MNRTSPNNHIAIVGMSGKFPRSANLEAFWSNLRMGQECITFFTDSELLDAGVDEKTISSDTYIKARGKLDDVELFDAQFFDLQSLEASLLDPQQRLMLECCWQACEDAGYMMEKIDLRGAVYVGQRIPTYYMHNLLPAGITNNSELDEFALRENSTSCLAARIARFLHFNGPAIVVQTACSTSLVALHLAVQSLLNLECDIAIAGGVAVTFPQVAGYWYLEGGIGSPDGHVRTFDEKAGGTVGGDGCGVVVLRRLNDAVRDGDTIHAVILGSAVANDGHRKVGFTAPSVSGQIEVILEALEVAETTASQISYVEAHGTGTVLGDPLELLALTEAFAHHGSGRRVCGLGSVKSNIGHVDAAAGIAGLIKTVLALKHSFIPASLHFQKPSPQFNLDESPFYIVKTGQPWAKTDSPRRAGVSSFGMGGTNAHVIIGEAPHIDRPSETAGPYLLPLSANSERALQRQLSNLDDTLGSYDVSLRDVEYTLQMGRRDLPYRTFIVVADTSEANRQIRYTLDSYESSAKKSDCRVMFVFFGQDLMDMGTLVEMYNSNKWFRHQMEQCEERISRHTEFELKTLLSHPISPVVASSEGSSTLQMRLLQISADYSLSRVWINMGVQPSAVIGHGMGVLTASCIAGILSLDDMLTLARESIEKGRTGRVQTIYRLETSKKQEEILLPPGVHYHTETKTEQILVEVDCESHEHFRAWCDTEGIGRQSADLRLMPSFYVEEKMSADLHYLLEKAQGRGKMSVPLFICCEKHTQMHSPIQNTFDQISTLPMTLMDFTDYLCNIYGNIRLLEIGFTRYLQAFYQPFFQTNRDFFTSFDYSPFTEPNTEKALLTTLGRLWKSGAKVEWNIYNNGKKGRRVPLPTYPFDRTKLYIGPKNPLKEMEKQPSSRV